MTLQIRGADASMTEELEELGAVFSHRDRTSDDPFAIMAAEGATLSRLRLWVDPYDEDDAPYLGGTNDLERTIRLARRSREAGLDVMLNLHYSDFWTDPKKQRLPRAWSELNESELIGAVEDYTLTVMRRFADEGVEVAYVQVGNEITNGMLWPVAARPATSSRRGDSRTWTRTSADDSSTPSPAFSQQEHGPSVPSHRIPGSSSTSTSAGRQTSTAAGSMRSPHAESTST